MQALLQIGQMKVHFLPKLSQINGVKILSKAVTIN
jgi:flagellar biosynthesis protein FliQ